MFKRVPILCLLQVVINADIIIALDEGKFLWAEKNIERYANNSRSFVAPGRWTKSIFNWLHSPLINSIQEAFVVDTECDSYVPISKYVKRSITKSSSNGLKIQENFVNSFFLWEDNEGNPLQFGLKQIQELKPFNKIDKVQEISCEDKANSFGEEPLFYEDNGDVKEVDIQHLSYHEKIKLNDILKNKIDSVVKHMLPFKKASNKTHSKYYTLNPKVSTKKSLTENKLKKNGLKMNSPSLRLLNNYKIYSEINEKKGLMETRNPVIELHSNVNEGLNGLPSFAESHSILHMGKAYISTDLLNNDSLCSIENHTTARVKTTYGCNTLGPVCLKYNISIGTTQVSYNDLRNVYIKSNTIGGIRQTTLVPEVSKTLNAGIRSSRTVHHKMFLKHRRKCKRKHFKYKHPDGSRSYTSMNYFGQKNLQ